jgi:hypothetical protein
MAAAQRKYSVRNKQLKSSAVEIIAIVAEISIADNINALINASSAFNCGHYITKANLKGSQKKKNR